MVIIYFQVNVYIFVLISLLTYLYVTYIILIIYTVLNNINVQYIQYLYIHYLHKICTYMYCTSSKAARDCCRFTYPMFLNRPMPTAT